MKPKPKEFIPIYGMFIYFKRYFTAEKRDWADANRAQWVQLYHFIVGLLILMPPVIWLFQKIS